MIDILIRHILKLFEFTALRKKCRHQSGTIFLTSNWRRWRNSLANCEGVVAYRINISLHTRGHDCVILCTIRYFSELHPFVDVRYQSSLIEWMNEWMNESVSVCVCVWERECVRERERERERVGRVGDLELAAYLDGHDLDSKVKLIFCDLEQLGQGQVGRCRHLKRHDVNDK